MAIKLRELVEKEVFTAREAAVLCMLGVGIDVLIEDLFAFLWPDEINRFDILRPKQQRVGKVISNINRKLRENECPYKVELGISRSTYRVDPL